tara:strand:+ start:2310 stop:2507 length:198 start_codon:yes stop_codon:yes gene_type:complete
MPENKKQNILLLDNLLREIKLIRSDIFLINNELKCIKDYIQINKREKIFNEKFIREAEVASGWWW